MARYSIAGLQVDMSVSGRTSKQAEPYLTEAIGPADMTIRCDLEDILRQQPEYGNLETAEYMATGVLFARQILRFDGFQLHSSAVMLDGKAYLFSAPSGTGKSTHTEKWCRLFGAKLLNDDKPILRRHPEGWIAYGSPWSGKHDLSTPEAVPLGGIAFLHRGEENTICPMSAEDAVPRLISQSLRYLRQEQMVLQLDLLDRLLKEVPVWKLTCRNDDEAAYVSREAMRC